MRKHSGIIIAVISIAVFFTFILNNIISNNDNLNSEEEFRGVFVSYLEYMKHFDGKDGNDLKREIDTIISNVKQNHFNTIILQVWSFSDSIYFSDILPFTHTITGEQGVRTSFDVLDYFIKIAHKNNIDLYAWINPYRVLSSTDTSFLDESSPAYLWLGTNNVKVIEGKGIFYNPASDDVIKLIVSGVEEIVENYDVDGVLLDDYFYPDQTIDLENYKEISNTISIADFRLSKVNELVSSIYKTIKEIDPNVTFGVSPDGNIERNYTSNYADVKLWLREDGYIDFIMPQLYYGFSNQNKPFIQTLNEWNDLIQNDTDLIVALGIYKSGEEDKYAGTGFNEWVEASDIIKRQIQVSRNMSHYIGYSIFRYDYFYPIGLKIQLQSEIDNYLSLFADD